MCCRLVICVAFLFSVFVGRSQQLHADTVNVSATGTHDSRNAIVYLPASYEVSKKYPLVIYLHGIGQAGTDIKKLYQTGLPKVLNDGYRPSFDFVMVAPQSDTYGIKPAWLEGILQDAEKRWGIDTNRIYITGIDAGGWAAYGSQLNISPTFAKKITAIVAISATTQNVAKENIAWWKASRTPFWAITGQTDNSYMSQNAALTDAVNKATPGIAALTILPGVGHSGWNDVYSGKIKQDGKTVWQWLAQFDRSKTFSKPHVTNLATAAASLKTASTAAAIATSKSVQVNIYGGANSYLSSAWNNWNVGLDLTYNSNSGALNYSDGTTSGISAVLSSSRNIGDNTDAYGSGMAPAPVLRYASFSSTARSLTLSGLSPTKTYTLELYASRNTNDGNATVFSVNGIARTINTYNNLNDKATFTSLSSNGDGEIKVSITGPNTFNYINGFTVTETTDDAQSASVPVIGSGIVRIEAEDFTAMAGVRTQATSDAGGGENVGWIDESDWMDYDVTVETAGTYTMKLRLASGAAGAQFQIKSSSGTVLGTIAVPATGGWQSWQDASVTVSLPAGNQTLRFQSIAAPIWNLNYFELSEASVTTPANGTVLNAGLRIEAEDFSDRSGVLKQTTRDFAGGYQNLFDVNYGDWVSYNINAPASGFYTLCLRVACDAAGSRFQIKNSSGTVLTTVDVPVTNGWQTWRDVTAVVNLSAGPQTLKLQAISTAGWNLNYFEVVKTPLNAFASYVLRMNSGTSIYLPLGLNLAHLKPGDTLNILGGTYNVIELGNFRGNTTNPIIIRNRGGQVTCKIIRFSNTPEFFKLLGNGQPGVTYGFKINGAYTTGSCLTAFGTDFEIAYVEGMQSKSGFFIKKNPVAGDPQSQYPNYEMDNISINHNYLHDILGEAMYIGHTGADGGQGGNPLLPVRMRNVEISYNIIDRTGWDGIQLANATTGNTIHHNKVTNFGTSNIYGQQAGILLGGNSQADIYDNIIKTGTGNGIQNFGFGLNKIYNNELEDVGRNGTTRGYESVYCNDIITTSQTRPKQQIQAYNNTIKYPMPWGAIRVSGYNRNSAPATMQYNKVLLPNAPSDWEKLYFPTYVPNSVISGNTLFTD